MSDSVSLAVTEPQSSGVRTCLIRRTPLTNLPLQSRKLHTKLKPTCPDVNVKRTLDSL